MMHNYGQHFIIDYQVLDRIIRYAGLTDTDTVLEIGGGTGILTKRLSKTAGSVVSIELDRRLAEQLKEMMKSSNVTVIQGDALRVDLPYFNKVVSNLPYQISSSITFRLLRHTFDYAILMYQLEFAKRLIAVPGTPEYGRLSVTAQYYGDIELLETVDPHAFKPRPKVWSAILKLTPQDPPYPVSDLGFFKRFLKAVFGQRRKKLRNSLHAAAPMLGIPVHNISRVDTEILDKRPETLSPYELAELADIISSIT
jgi:16S rRNA (adenine1518-N6/adenine1519-N6)-dimethyltransferase